MPPTELEQRVLCRVIDRFLNSGETTNRIALNREFEDPDAIDRLKQWMLLKTFDDANYLPTALSFHYCGNAEIEDLAKRSVEVFARVFRNMYMNGDSDFSPEKLKAKAKAVDDRCDDEIIGLGLYLAPDFGLLSSFTGGNHQRINVTPIAISERVVKLKNIDILWDTYMRERVPWVVQDSSGGVLPRHPMFDSKQDDEVVEEETEEIVITEQGEAGEAPKESTVRAKSKLLILISHSSKDTELAESLIDLLRAALPLSPKEIRCTSVDGYRLPLGVKTDEQLRDEIVRVKLLIGLLTPNSISSTYVLFELGARWGANLPMIPLWAGIKSDVVAGPIRGVNAAKCDKVSHLIQLVEQIGEQLHLKIENTSSFISKAERVVQAASIAFVNEPSGGRGGRQAVEETGDLRERILDFVRSQPVIPGATDAAVPLTIDNLEKGLQEPQGSIRNALRSLEDQKLVRYDKLFHGWIFLRK
jgi:hypothetical protein